MIQSSRLVLDGVQSDGQNSNNNASKDHVKIHDFDPQGLPKSTKMVPRGTLEATLEGVKRATAKRPF